MKTTRYESYKILGSMMTLGGERIELREITHPVYNWYELACNDTQDSTLMTFDAGQLKQLANILLQTITDKYPYSFIEKTEKLSQQQIEKNKENIDKIKRQLDIRSLDNES